MVMISTLSVYFTVAYLLNNGTADIMANPDYRPINLGL